MRRQRNFGFDGLAPISEPGINAKLSELHAAVGLCVLPLVDAAIRARRARYELYREELAQLGARLRLPAPPDDFTWNYAYLPVVLEDEE